MSSEKKYKSIILYFANRIRNGTLGKVKLMKLLYYLDFDFFEKYGKSVTDDKYIRLPLGPVPMNAQEILNEMKKEGSIKIKKEKICYNLKDKEEICALKNPDINVFSKEEIQMLEEISAKWEKFTGTEMKNASHGEAPWIATKPNEIIDYNLAYYRNNYGEMENI